jgi:branched-chain amino acid transport system substrate-binding protein
MKEWRDFMARYIPDGDMGDNNYTYAYGVGLTLLQALKQCGNDFSRENILKQATNLAPLELPTLLPGVKVGTSPDNYHPIRHMQLQRWDGKGWVRFGNVIEGANV